MANIQYIGARYVPKIYENPDDHSTNWKSGVSYEPLTEVTYLDDTYTSRKPVSASVGNPADNPSYWAKTANYNAALQALSHRVDDLEEDVDTVETNIGTISSLQTKSTNLVGGINEVRKLHNVKGHKILFVGDSYGTISDNCVGAFLDCLGIHDTAYYRSVCVGGSGFIDASKQFWDQVVNYSGSIPRNEFTDIIVIGGVNDADPDNNPSLNLIDDAIEAFMEYVNEEYPFANVYVGCVGAVDGNGVHADYAANLNTVVLQGYKNCIKHGAIYLNGVENVLNQHSLLDTDGVHPTANGSAELGAALAQAWLGGEATVNRNTQSVTLTSGVTVDSGFHLYSAQEDDNVTINITGLLTLDTAINITSQTQEIKLFDMFSPLINSLHETFTVIDAIDVDVQLFTYDGSYHGEYVHPGALFFDKTGAGYLSIREYGINVSDVKRFYICPTTKVINLFRHR